MQISPYLNFPGNCEEAFKFYEKTLGGQIIAMMKSKDMPQADCPEGAEDTVMHARILVGGTMLMGSDAPPSVFKPAQGTSINIGVETTEESDRIFHALEEGGNVLMPYGETFWAYRFGLVVDRFGTLWMVNCEKPMGN